MKPTAVPAARAAEKALQTGLRRVPAASSREAKLDAGAKAARPSLQALTELWLCMVAAFGHRWSGSHGELPIDDQEHLTITGGIWQRGLIGVTDAQVREGFERSIARADDWPPTLPAFRSLALGVPSLAQVKGELRATQTQQDRSPFSRLVWQYLDSYRFARADVDAAERMLREAYELAHDYVMRGGPIPEGSLALAPPPSEQRTPASDETAEANMRAIADILSKPPSAKDDAA